MLFITFPPYSPPLVVEVIVRVDVIRVAVIGGDGGVLTTPYSI
jgi:hypothetical protein